MKLGQKMTLVSALKSQKEGLKRVTSLQDKIKALTPSSSRSDNIDQFIQKLRADKSVNDFVVINGSEIEYCEELGRGGSGSVWRALLTYKEGHRISVAVKVLFDGADVEAFKSEFSILNAVRDNSVVRLIGLSITPKLGMVMEYCSQGSLYHFLKTHEAFNWGLFFHFFPLILEGIKFLHGHNPQILHRDLKSQNLLVTENHQIRVADFGLARKNTDSHEETLRSVEGTVHYMPPELLQRIKYSDKSDIYSLSIVLWEMVTRILVGKYVTPYAGLVDDHGGPAGAMVLFFQVCNQHLRPKIPDNTPPSLSKLMVQCWQPNPQDRPTIADLISAVEQSHQDYSQDPSSWQKLEKFGTEGPDTWRRRWTASDQRGSVDGERERLALEKERSLMEGDHPSRPGVAKKTTIKQNLAAGLPAITVEPDQPTDSPRASHVDPQDGSFPVSQPHTASHTLHHGNPPPGAVSSAPPAFPTSTSDLTGIQTSSVQRSKLQLSANQKQELGRPNNSRKRAKSFG